MPEGDVRELLIFSFRYALGRSSSAPHTVAGLIRDNIHALAEFDINQIIREIESAEERGRLTEPFNQKVWEDLKIFLKGQR